MSAPEDGETRAAEHLAPGDGRAFWFLTELYVAKRVTEDTDGAFTVFEVTASPQSPPAPHTHHHEDETYYVLDGEFEFLDVDRTFTAGAGSLVHLPKDRLHSHRNPGDSPAKALVFYRPAGVEKFVEEAGKPAADPTSLPPPPDEADIARLLAVAAKYASRRRRRPDKSAHSGCAGRLRPHAHRRADEPFDAGTRANNE